MIKVFPASLEKLYDMLSFIREQAREAGFDEDFAAKIELAVEEALVNIISYGYPNLEGNIEIHCSSLETSGLNITIKDRGVPYNPLTNAKTFDPNAPLETRSVGGYGIYFILKIMDEVNYKRENECNILTMLKFATNRQDFL